MKTQPQEPQTVIHHGIAYGVYAGNSESDYTAFTAHWSGDYKTLAGAWKGFDRHAPDSILAKLGRLEGTVAESTTVTYLATYTNADAAVEGRAWVRPGDGRIVTALVDLDVEADFLDSSASTRNDNGLMLSRIFPADRIDDAKAHAASLAS